MRNLWYKLKKRLFGEVYYVNIIKLRGLDKYEVCAELHRTREEAVRKAATFSDARAYTYHTTVKVKMKD